MLRNLEFLQVRGAHTQPLQGGNHSSMGSNHTYWGSNHSSRGSIHRQTPNHCKEIRSSAVNNSSIRSIHSQASTQYKGKSNIKRSNRTSRGSIHRQTPNQCKGKIISTAVKSHLKGVHSQANTQPQVCGIIPNTQRPTMANQKAGFHGVSTISPTTFETLP